MQEGVSLLCKELSSYARRISILLLEFQEALSRESHKWWTIFFEKILGGASSFSGLCFLENIFKEYRSLERKRFILSFVLKGPALSSFFSFNVKTKKMHVASWMLLPMPWKKDNLSFFRMFDNSFSIDDSQWT